MKIFTGYCTEWTSRENMSVESQSAWMVWCVLKYSPPVSGSSAVNCSTCMFKSGPPCSPTTRCAPFSLPHLWVFLCTKHCCIRAVLTMMSALYWIPMTPLISPYSLYSNQRLLQVLLLPTVCVCASCTLWNESKICDPYAYGDTDTEGVICGHHGEILIHMWKIKGVLLDPFIHKDSSPNIILRYNGLGLFFHQNVAVSFKVQNLLSSLSSRLPDTLNYSLNFKVTFFIHMLT